ncbi:MAG: glycosyltransferase family 2 protein [Hyphomicrobiales bacterium]|nr:glycosyltransferase family 2 protein [Hyphomicrobiales bacterium]
MADQPNVAILLATRNGAAFLDEQLQSLADQTWPAIDVWASDDGSSDATLDILTAWSKKWSKGVFRISEGPQKGFAENFRTLICNGKIEADYFAFCDQDDIWEDRKLKLAIEWMAAQDAGLPLLFCSRTLTVSSTGEPIGHSPLFRRQPSFRNAIVQSIAGGNTMVLNKAARDCLAVASGRTGFVSHDWWAYMVVTGAGGVTRYCDTPLVHYRQHGANVVGANNSWRARRARMKALFHGQFARWNDANMRGLEMNRDLLTKDAISVLEAFADARSAGAVASMKMLRASGVQRQTAGGTALLWAAVALGLM